MPATRAPLTILLATHNGAAHLPAQLASLAAQTHRDWSLLVSDDASRDSTGAVLAEFQAAHAHRHDIRIIQGPGRGAAANFLHLLAHAPPDGPVALCDQDDVWLPGKLARAMVVAGGAIGSAAGPMAYGAQSVVTDARLHPIGQTDAPRRPPSLGNALLQNILGGHGTVLNPAAVRMLQQAGPVAVPFHDWWIYLLMTAAGGHVIIDRAVTTLYRQHPGNALGASRGGAARLNRAGQLMNRDYGGWLRANLAALATAAPLLTPAATTLTQATTLALGRPGPARAATIARLGLHRQTGAQTAAVLAAMALGRV